MAAQSKQYIHLGPKNNDIRTARPYFLIPLLMNDGGKARKAAVRETIDFARGLPKKVTDVFVFSHGWHRNLFGAVSAYDRLISRFAVLQSRGILQPHDPETFNPLFVALHWNSDPEIDGWIDTAGRRDRVDFVLRMRDQFDVHPDSGVCHAELINLYNRIYDLFTYISAPGTDVNTGSKDAEADDLFRLLDVGTLIRDAMPDDRPGAEVAQSGTSKTTMAWRCYEESRPMKLLYGQSTPPRPFNNPLQAIWSLVRFTLSILAAAGLLLALVGKLSGFLAHRLDFVYAFLQRYLGHIKVTWAFAGEAYSAAMIGSLAILALMAGYNSIKGRDRKTTRIPILTSIVWLTAQVTMLLPVLTLMLSKVFFQSPFIIFAPIIGLCFHSTLLGWGIAGALLVWAFVAYALKLPPIGAFSEREAREATKWTPQYILTDFARIPFYLLDRAVSADSAVHSFAEGLDRQIAFASMQWRAVAAGQEAADMVLDLHKELSTEESKIRVHLIGHSFGALLVSNLARKTAELTGYGKDVIPTGMQFIHSICLLQAAQGSDWFHKEKWSADPAFLSGTLACVHSAYDTATGSIYPLANSSRRGAGSVGLFDPGGKTAEEIGDKPPLTSVSRPSEVELPPSDPPLLVNIDASRIIYNGPVASGGGHDDVFKDDVINIVWAVTAHRPKREQSTPPVAKSTAAGVAKP